MMPDALEKFTGSVFTFTKSVDFSFNENHDNVLDTPK